MFVENLSLDPLNDQIMPGAYVCCLTGHGGVESKRPEAGEFFASGLLHAVAEDILPGVELQQLYALQDLCRLFQTVCGVFLQGRIKTRRQFNIHFL